MNMYASLALCFIPLCVVFFIATRFCTVSVFHSFFSILLGLAAVVPISILQIYGAGNAFFNSQNWGIQLIRMILVNGLTEEIVKMLALFLLPAKKMKLLQFFGCALLVGMSLGCFESVIYFLQRLQHANLVGAHLVYTQIFTRMFTTDIVHAFCCALTSFVVWNVRNQKIVIFPLVYAVLVHGLYDFFALYEIFHFFAIVAILFAAVECRVLYTRQPADEIENAHFLR